MHPRSRPMNAPPTRPQRRRLPEPNPAILPLADQNSWYYPSHGYESDEEDLSAAVPGGNWGRKHLKGSRHVRSGKMTAWGPRMDEWEAEERCRKRLKLLIPREDRSPSPPRLPHLARSPTPPLVMPFPQPRRQHYTYTSAVMDKAVTHTFRSPLLDELEDVTNRLIEGEAAMKRTLGTLWQVINEDYTVKEPAVAKQEEMEIDPNEGGESSRRASSPDLTPRVHKLFMLHTQPNLDETYDRYYTPHPHVQQDNLEKCLASLRELQDDGREYVERLQEIRNSLGDIKWQKDRMWEEIRRRAISELQETARATEM